MTKRLLSLLMVLLLAVGVLPAASATGAEAEPTFSDMPDNWSTEALNSAVANGLLIGDNGKIMPANPLTRAQMATIIVRAFGATVEGDISAYTDVKSTDWFASSIAKAFKMGVMQGYAGKMNPHSNITREEAFAVLARALKLEPAENCNKTFEDIDNVSGWARGEIYALANAGYIQGSNGKLNPQSNISRAEFAQVMYNINKQYISKGGEYTEVADGNVMVNAPGVTLKGLTVNGDLIIGDGVGDGNVVLDDVIVTGRLVIRGGGENSIIIKGNSSIRSIILTRVDGRVAVKIEGATDVETIFVDDGSDDVIITGNVGRIRIEAPGIAVALENVNVNAIEVLREKANILIGQGSVVQQMDIRERANDTNAEVRGRVGVLTTSASSNRITGTGTVTVVNVLQSASQIAVETRNTRVTVAQGATGVTGIGGTAIDSGTTIITPGGTTGGTTGGGGGGGTPPASAIQANLQPTGNVGIAPDNAGEAAGKIYAEYKLVANEEDISLAEGNVDYIKVKEGAGEFKELPANTDATLWFNVEADKGERSYEVKTKDGKVYTATLNWNEEIDTATWEETGEEGEHEGVTYVEYKLKDGEEKQISLKEEDVKVIAIKDANGKWIELKANTDATLWFNKAKDTGNYKFFIVTNENKMYKATLEWTVPVEEGT